MKVLKLSVFIAVCGLAHLKAQLSTDDTTFPTYKTGIYTTTIKITNQALAQTNAIVKVGSNQVFKAISMPFGSVVTFDGAYGSANWNNGDQLAVSLDGTNYTIVTSGLTVGIIGGGGIPVINGPAWIKYIHQAVNNTPVVFITYSLYPNNPTPVIHY